MQTVQCLHRVQMTLFAAWGYPSMFTAPQRGGLEMNMKILIGYYTKSGTTAKCAAMLGEQFHNHEITVVDLSGETVAPDAYDVILLGAPIRMGHVDSRLRAFVRDNQAVLATRKAGYFACCGAPELAREVLERDLPADLIRSAVTLGAFGGELNVEAQRGFFAKMTVRMMRRAIKNNQLDEDLCERENDGYPEILPDHIARFADEIKRM